MAKTLENNSVSVQEPPLLPAKPGIPSEKEVRSTSPSRSRGKAGLILFFLTIAVLGTLVYNRWKMGHAFPEGLIQVNGRIEGDRVTISSKFAGRIETLFAREGATVTRGQTLVQIDDAQTRNKLDEARADFQIALAQAQGATTSVALTSATTNAQILQSEGSVQQSERGVSGAVADWQRAIASIASARATVRAAEANVVTAQAAVEAAQASKTQAEAGVRSAEAQITTAQANVNAAEATVRAAQADADRASHDAVRMAQLLTQNAVSAQAADQANFAAQAAKAQRESAQQQVSAAKSVVLARQSEAEAAQQQVAAATAAIRQAQAQWRAAQEQANAALASEKQAVAQAHSNQQMVGQARAKRQQALGDLAKAHTAPQQVEISRASQSQTQGRILQTGASVKEQESVLHDMRLISPVAGTITTRMRDTGEVVSAGTPVLDLVDLDKLYLKAYVPATQIGKLRLGLPVRIYTDSFPDTFFEATVGYIASTAEFTPKEVQTPDERVKLIYAVKLYVKDNAKRRLTPGMVADAVIQWKEGEKWQKPRW